MPEARNRDRSLPAAQETTVEPLGSVRRVFNLEGSQLGNVVVQIQERMGPNVIRKATAIPGYNHIETGIFTLDMALLGGLPEGLVAMIYGWESSGKTTLAQRVAGSCMRKYPDKAVVFVDLEHSFDRAWGATHGIDDDRLMLVQPESGEQAVDIIDAVIRTPEVSLIIIDSLPAIVPMKEADESAEDSQVALRARLTGKLCSKINDATGKSRNLYGAAPTTIFINQWRTKIGVMHGDPRVLPCGNQPKYISMTMIEMKNKEILGRNERGIEIAAHNEHSFVIKKSKVGNSMRNGEFKMIRDPAHPLGAGAIDEATTVATFAKKFGLITGGGASWHIDGVGQKFGKLVEIENFLNEFPEEQMELKRRVIMQQRRDMGVSMLPPDGWLCGAYLEIDE